jgi:hypothetical protein
MKKKKKNEPDKGGHGVGVFRSDGYGVGGIRRRGGGGEREEKFCWVEEEEACGACIGLRVKWYFSCTVQTCTVQP